MEQYCACCNVLYTLQWEPDISGLPVYSTNGMESRLNICKKCGSAGKFKVKYAIPTMYMYMCIHVYNMQCMHHVKYIHIHLSLYRLAVYVV